MIIKFNKFSIKESKVSDAVIEVFEILINQLGDNLERSSINKEFIYKLAIEILPEDLITIYQKSKDFIFDMIEDKFTLNINENNIFDEDDENYDEEELKRGEEIQKEHKPTYDKIKKFIELTGDLPPKEDVYKSIAKDHMDEPDGVGELYYDDKVGLEEWENELKNKFKKLKKSENVLTFKEIFETVNFDKVEELMQKIRDRYSKEEIDTMVDEAMLEYIPDNWEEEYDSEYDAYQEVGRGEAEHDIISMMINSVSNGEITIDDYSELTQIIADEYNINLY